MSQFAPNIIQYINFVDDYIIKKKKHRGNHHKDTLRAISEVVAHYIETQFSALGSVSKSEIAMEGVDAANPADWVHDVIMMRVAEPLFYRSRAPTDYLKEANQYVDANLDEFLDGRRFGGREKEDAAHGIKHGDWLITPQQAESVADDIRILVEQEIKKHNPPGRAH